MVRRCRETADVSNAGKVSYWGMACLQLGATEPEKSGFSNLLSTGHIEAERPERAQLAEGAPTQAVKARLLDEAVYWDQLAADADRRAGKPAGS